MSSHATFESGDGATDFDDPGVWRLHEEYARHHERATRDRLVAHYEPLVHALARRFYRGREGLDDLVQVAYEGLLHALERFDPARGLPFPVFASPTMAGLLKRHFRDNGWAIRVPRRVHEMHRPLTDATERLTQRLGRPPLVDELAGELAVDGDKVLEAMAATGARATASLDSPPVGGGAGETDLAGQIGFEDGRLAMVENRHALLQMLPRLSDDDRSLLELYFGQELTQAEIAGRLGVSQMQISRLLSAALRRLRGHLLAD